MLLLLKIVRRLHFILFTFFTVTSFAQDGIVNGIVKDGDTILQSATISIANKTILTNSKGEFTVTLKPGAYKLIITHTGYKKAEETFTLSAGEIKSFQFNMVREDLLSEVVVLGSRSSIQRSNMNTPAPIDLISTRQLFPGQTELTKQLSIAVPSFNSFNQTLGNGSAVSPAALRGLGPDETLVLINGQRRHTSAFIFSNYSIGYGTAAVDLNAIPSAAIENIQILRDGASAHYGSDAIGGVINLQLKKTTGITAVSY